MKREILWTVPAWATVLMYALYVVAAAVLVRGIWSRVRIWRRGRRNGETRPAGDALRALMRHAVAQVRIWRSPAAGLSHFGIFWGFIVLFIGTCIVAVEEWTTRLFGLDQFIFHGWFYISVSCALEVFGLLFIGGLVLAMIRRRADPRFRPLARPVDAAILWLFLALGVTGFAVEGLRIAGAAGGMEANDFERWSFVGWGIASLVDGLGEGVLRGAHLSLWLVHMVMSMAFIAIIPYCKLRHIFFSPLNVAVSAPRRPGALAGVSMEEVEETGKYGVASPGDFTWRQLVSFDACTECARCQNACPAHATGKPLSPMRVVLDVASCAANGRELHGETIAPEVLWSCTTCGACVAECPVAIDQLGAIIDMRRHLVGEGQIRGSEQKALRSIAAASNPWGLPQEERSAWADGLDVPTIDEEPDAEVLFWVGCAGSYDARNQKVSRALVEVLRAAGVRFAVLGARERCTGDPARRMGDEFTYSELATANIETLRAAKPKRIVTACPHCFNTIRNEYPALGGDFEVVHHSQLIAELIRDGLIPRDGAATTSRRVVFHDPCYLARHNGESDAPRDVLRASGARLEEPARARENGFCCGAGGGRMWMEEDIGERVNAARWRELSVVQPDVVAVSCPFCMTMMTDAAGAEDSAVSVEDIAEVLARELEGRTERAGER